MILQKIKVVEFAGLAPAPFCGKVLADYGANVVKLEKPLAAQFSFLDANKRSVFVDLKNSFGLRVAKKICETYDVLIDPYRPGVLEKLGLGPQDIMKKNPKLIYARLSGYGQTGPMSRAAGHDINYVALSGILSRLGRKETVPTPPINLLADFAGGGLLCAFGIVLSLFDRMNTGHGRVVDLSMSEGAAYVGSWLYASKNSLLWGQPRGENLLDSGAHFYDTYETKDGRYMTVGAIEGQFYEQLLKGLGYNPGELDHMTDFEKNKDIISSKFREKTQKEWTEIFEKLDACVVPILTMDEAPHHPHNVDRENFYKVMGQWLPTPAPKLTDMHGNVSKAAEERPKDNPPYPESGQHTMEVLQELGYTQQEIQKLVSEGGVVISNSKSKL